MRTRRAGLHTLVGAYVMDAVSDTDRAGFERHLLTCEQCREDVRGLREATARLAQAAAVLPRAELRDQTLKAAERVRQLPPAVPGGKHDRLAGNRRGIGGRRPGLRSLPGTGRPAVLPRWWPTGISSRPWLARTAVAVAVALAATATVFGLHLSSMQHRLTAAQQRDAAIAAVLGARDATRMTAHVSTGGTATVVMSHRAHALVFVASGLTRLPASRAYELWLMNPAGNTAAGMLPQGRNGMSGPMVVRKLAQGDQLAMTVEPAAGTPAPTSAPVVLVTLGS